MESKSLLASKTFWGSILTPVFTWLATKYGFDLDAETQVAIVGAASAIAGIALRKITSGPVHVVKP